jgi:hypothetical protein
VTVLPKGLVSHPPHCLRTRSPGFLLTSWRVEWDDIRPVEEGYFICPSASLTGPQDPFPSRAYILHTLCPFKVA